MSSSVKNLACEIGADNYLIAGNGAMIYDIKNDEIIYNKFMDKEKILKIIKICEDNSIFYNVYTETTILTKNLNYNVLFYHHENIKKSEDKQTNIKIIPDLYKYIEESENENYLKITICDENKIIFNRISEKIKNIKNVNILDVAHMSRKIIKSGTEKIEIGYYYTEVTNKNIDKWTAIQFLINVLQIKEEEVATIGDNVNDKEMLENAKLGIAMGNSAPYIKEISDIVTLDNNESGVSYAIEKYII